MAREAVSKRTGTEERVLLALLDLEPTPTNLVCSPALVRLGLTVLATGAREATAAALATVVGDHGARAAAALRADLDQLGADLPAPGADPDADRLLFAAGLWARVPVYAEWRRRVPFVGVGQLGVDDPDAWVREATGGRIDRLAVDTGPDTLAALALAADLKASWLEPFNEAATVDGPFAGAAGPVPYLRRRSRTFALWRDGDLTAVQLPYLPPSDGGEALVLVAGTGGDGPVDTTRAVLDLTGQPPEADVEVDLALPRFRIDRRAERGLDLRGLLVALGLGVLFEDDCDLGDLSPEPLKLSEARSQALVDVDEHGTSATATVEFAMVRAAGMPPPPAEVVTVRFDRPFAYLVRRGTTGPILFAGWVEDPSRR